MNQDPNVPIFLAPDGRMYFYNSSQAESTWERPQALKDLDDARTALSRSQMNVQMPLMTQGNVTFDNTGSMVNNASINKRQLELEAEKERKRKEDSEKAKQAAKPQDKSRPISSTPISGTPW